MDTISHATCFVRHSRGKDFLVNGMKWKGGEVGEDEKEDIDDEEEQTTSSDDGMDWQPSTEDQTLPDLFAHSVNLTEAEAKFIARQQQNLSEAEAAFIARQSSSPSRIGDEDGEEGEVAEARWDQEAFMRREDFSRTLPNWTVREEVNFWLHGEGDDEYINSEEDISSEEEDEESGESELDTEDEGEESMSREKIIKSSGLEDKETTNAKASMYWGRQEGTNNVKE